MPTKHRSMVGSGMHTAFTNVLQAAGVLLTAAIIARLLGSEGKGAYDLYLTTAGLLSLVLGLSLTSGITYVVASMKIDVNNIKHFAVGYGILQGGAAAIVLLLIAHLSPTLLNVPTQISSVWIPLIVVTVISLSLSSMFRSILAGQRRFTTANYGDLAKQALGLTLLLVAVASVNALGISLLDAIIAANILTVLLTAGIYSSSISGGSGHNTPVRGFRQAFRYAIPSHLGNIAQFLNYRLDVFFVNSILGTAQLGVYQVAVLLCQSLSMVPGAAQAVLFPTIAASNVAQQHNAAITAQVSRMLTILNVVGGLLLACTAPRLIPMVFGKSFQESSLALVWLLPGVIAFGTVTTVAGYFAGIGKPKLNLLASLVGVVVTVPLDLLLIPYWGIVGAAMASSASYTASAVVTMALFCRLTGLSVSCLLVPSKADIDIVRKVPTALRQLLKTSHRR